MTCQTNNKVIKFSARCLVNTASKQSLFPLALWVSVVIIEAWCVDSEYVSVSVSPRVCFQDSALYLIQLQLHVCRTNRRSVYNAKSRSILAFICHRKPRLIENYIASFARGEAIYLAQGIGNSYTRRLSRFWSPFYSIFTTVQRRRLVRLETRK